MPPQDTQTQPTSTQTPPPKKRINLSLDIKSLIIILLIIALGSVLYLWGPWSGKTNDDSRIVSVTGQATIKAEPDEYVFYPSYDFKNADKDAALAAMTKKSDELVAKIKELGVEDKDIKTNAGGYEQGAYYPIVDSDSTTYTLSLTITLSSRELAQKIQDYLVSTAPTGAVSPLATFSKEKQNQLESQARDEATKDARAKADQSAKNLGFKINKVKSVEDGYGFGDILPMEGDARTLDSGSSAAQAPKLSVQPGENELSYSVTVIYYIK